MVMKKILSALQLRAVVEEALEEVQLEVANQLAEVEEGIQLQVVKLQQQQLLVKASVAKKQMLSWRKMTMRENFQPNPQRLMTRREKNLHLRLHKKELRERRSRIAMKKVNLILLMMTKAKKKKSHQKEVLPKHRQRNHLSQSQHKLLKLLQVKTVRRQEKGRKAKKMMKMRKWMS
jgi:hypothetical protein